MDNGTVQVKNACSFCGKSEADVRRLIQGMEGRICDECAGLFSRMLALRKEEEPEIVCSFCRAPKQRLVIGRGARICGSCLELCGELAEEGN